MGGPLVAVVPSARVAVLAAPALPAVPATAASPPSQASTSAGVRRRAASSLAESVAPGRRSSSPAATGVHSTADPSGGLSGASSSAADGSAAAPAIQGSQSRNGRPYQSPASHRAAPRSSQGGRRAGLPAAAAVPPAPAPAPARPARSSSPPAPAKP